MTTFLLDRTDCDLDIEGETIVLRAQGQRTGTVPLRLVERIVIGRGARLTSRALTRLARAGIGLIIEPSRWSPGGPTVLAPAPGDRLLRLAQYDLALDPAGRAAVAAGFVRGRIEGARAAEPQYLPMGGNRLDRALADLGRSPSLERLRGIEGAAAAAIFARFAARVPKPFHVPGRNRRPPRDPVNALLSLGYTMAQFEAVRLATRAGLDPALGIYHETGRGRDSLACDLVEPARPVVEDWTIALAGSGEIGADDFTTRGPDGCRLLKEARRKVYRSFEETAQPRIQAVLDAEIGRVVAALRARAAARPALAALARAAAGAGALALEPLKMDAGGAGQGDDGAAAWLDA
jgi:CRISPR-associated protein Cas1